jgi:hypothetical protein
MTETYYIFYENEENILKLAKFKNEYELKLFITEKISGFKLDENDLENDQDFIKYYMQMSLSKLIQKANKFYPEWIQIKNIIIGNELSY